MDLERVQEEDGNDAGGGCRNVGREDIIDPFDHDVLREPRLRLTLVDSVSRVGGQFAALDCRPSLT